MSRKNLQTFLRKSGKNQQNLAEYSREYFFTVRSVDIDRRFGTPKREGGMLPTGSLTAE